ncbi:MAG: hypothetical protein EP346_10740 [Bacteroidetes bacterium]|nr:MAG: hypothetical protein EP346_10740 [Bacteroidota bacterium]
MKKALSLLLGILLSCSVFAQPKINVGVTASGGLGHYSYSSHNIEINYFSGTVYQTGIVAELVLNKEYSIRLAGTYISNGNTSTVMLRDANGVEQGAYTSRDHLIANTIDMGVRYTLPFNNFRLVPGVGFSFGSAYQIHSKITELNREFTFAFEDSRFNYLSGYLECLAQFDLNREIVLNAGLSGNLGLFKFDDDILLNAPHNIQLKVEVLYRLN